MIMAQISGPRVGLSWIGLLVSLAVLTAGAARADSWAAPSDTLYHSENGRYEFFVHILDSKQLANGSTGALRRQQGDRWEQVWARGLENRICPVTAMVTDSGKYVVTFDEHLSVGRNPVVIYGEGGRLIANLSLVDLKLEDHPNISRSVSSYWWNEYAIMVFGPPAAGNGSCCYRPLRGLGRASMEGRTGWQQSQRPREDRA